MIKVLAIDDSALVRKLIGRIFADAQEFEVHLARDGADGLKQLHVLRPDVVTLDIHMPGMDGLECLDRIMVERPCPVVMVSSLSREGAEVTLAALRRGAVDFVPKPEGAVSLQLEQFAPSLIAKVRAASKAKLRASLRLRERVQHQISGVASKYRASNGEAAIGERATGRGVVLVGASTGGPPALETLLSALPASFPWPIVIAQHMPASFTGPLARRLDGVCAIAVTEVASETALASGCAYIGRGDADIVIATENGQFVATPAPALPNSPWHPSVDRLVESALNHAAPRQLIGILLTGMGNDGMGAMSRLRALGGRTIAESKETAVVWGMPGELARSGGATWVLPLPKIVDKLKRLTAEDHATRS